MIPSARIRPLAAAALGLTVACVAAAEPSFERTEQREDCLQHDPQRRPLFGDLHVHSLYSFDSYTSGQRNDPDGAYRYARGEAILLPDVDGAQVVEARIRRPLDFAAVTDHAELLGESRPARFCAACTRPLDLAHLLTSPPCCEAKERAH